MRAAHSLESIRLGLSSQLSRTAITRKETPKLRSMLTLDVDRTIRDQNVRIEESRNSKLIGILFSHPSAPLAKSEILGQLPHFHLRSGDAVDFFCIGYGTDWPENHYADQKSVVRIGGVDWLFSEKAYSDVIDQLEQETTWKYSGETELILVSAIKDNLDNVVLDYSSAIVCNLDTMAKDEAFSTVRSFFTEIFRYAKTNNQVAPFNLSDNRGIALGKSALKKAILSLLPSNLKESYKKAEHYAIRNIA